MAEDATTTKEKVLKSWFDLLILQALSYVRLDHYYLEKKWFRQFVRYGIIQTIVFWIVKAPLIQLFSGVMGWMFATFIVGVAITIVGFVIEKLYVFKA